MVQEQKVNEVARPWRLCWPDPVVLTVSGVDVDAFGIGRDEQGSFLIKKDGSAHRIPEHGLSAKSAILVNLEAMNFREGFAKTRKSPWLRARMKVDHEGFIAGEEVFAWSEPGWAHYARQAGDSLHPAPTNKWRVKVDFGMGWCRAGAKLDRTVQMQVPDHKLEILK